MNILGYILLVISFIVIFSLILYLYLYKKQLRALTAQLLFHRNTSSNKEIVIDLSGHDVRELQTQLNELLIQHRSHEQLCQKEEDKLRSLITNISHDIRTPLTSIDGYFQLLLESENPEEKTKYAKIIRGRLDALNALLEEFFSYSKLQNTDYPVNLTSCDIKQILCETLFLFYDDMKKAGIEPQITLCDAPLTGEADSDYLHRIFFNITRNALIHGKKQIQITCTKEKDDCVIRFINPTDEPLPDDCSQVFERFYQADRARSSTSSGLGLYIAKELLQKTGGSISACSREPDLFIIEIRLPLVKNENLPHV